MTQKNAVTGQQMKNRPDMLLYCFDRPYCWYFADFALSVIFNPETPQSLRSKFFLLIFLSILLHADRQRVASQVGCQRRVNFVHPSSISNVVSGIKTTVDRDSSLLHVAGLASLQQGSNTDSAVEVVFKRPTRLTGIWLREQV